MPEKRAFFFARQKVSPDAEQSSSRAAADAFLSHIKRENMRNFSSGIYSQKVPS